MSSMLKKSVLGSAVALALLAGGQAVASELTANAGIVSNYVYRGETQNGDLSAIQGGIDYSHDSGFYVGTWSSSLNAASGYEMDIYAGYGFEVAGIGMDVGYISYMYPMGETNGDPSTENKYDFQEIYVGASYGMFSAKYSYSDNYLGHSEYAPDGAKKSAYYLELGMDYPLSDDMTLGLHVGQKAGAFFDVDAAQCTTTICDGAVTDYSVALSKGEFSFKVSNMDNKKSSVAAQSDNFRVIVGYTHDIAL